MLPIEFVIPGQPVPKGRPRVTKNGTFTPKRVREYERKCKDFAAMAMKGRTLLSKDAHVFLRLFFGDRRRRDIDNAAKSLLDGFNGAIYTDDSIISILRVERGYDKESPRAEVRVCCGEGDEP